MLRSIQPSRAPSRVQLLLIPLALLFAMTQGASASDYQVISEETEQIDLPFGQLWLTETRVQEGPESINQFSVHRLRRPFGPSRGVVTLLPSLGNHFGMYLFHESGNIRWSFAAFFARLGYDVWGYSPRTTGIQSGDCGGVLDCTPILDWSLQTVVDDVTYLRSMIEAEAPGSEVVVGGLSLGSISALAVVNANPADWDGVIAWEGSAISDDPAVQAHNLPYYQQLDAALGAGIAVDDQSLPFVKLVALLAETAPNDPFVIPVPGFPPGLTNHQAFVFVLSVPNPVAPSPRNGFVTAIGDFTVDQLAYSADARLFRNIERFNDVTANGVTRDLYGSLAGVVTSYTSNLAVFQGPALVISAEHGFGSIMSELPAKLGSTDVTTLAMDDFGHVDHFGSNGHWFFLELPIAAWLSAVFGS